MAPTSFVDSGYASRAEYEKSLSGGGSFASVPTLGYWKIKGLAAASRMM